ncbi:trans-sialidase, partial [Trypanosoma cruzi]
MRLVGSGGSGVQMEDGTLVFPLEGTKKLNGAAEDGKTTTVSLIIHSVKDIASWKLSKGMSADGCGVPSVVEWEKDKLMMMTACDDGRRRVYESGDKGDSWTEALGTLSRVWGNKKGVKVELVGSGFTTATIDKKKVMLVILPVYSKGEKEEKGELHLWLTDNTHIVDIGPVSGKDDDEVTASSLLYKSGGNGGKKDELIALYEKKKGVEETSSGMASVLLTEQLEKVKEVLATWKKADERVSQLCTSESVGRDTLPGTACSADIKITDGLVGFLSGNFSDKTWRDEYLGVNATLDNEGVEQVETGVKFKGRSAGAEWPVGKQGDNQLYHFANYNFTLVATVSIDGEPKEGNIPLLGVRLDGEGEKKLMELSYDREKKWILLCGGETHKKHSSTWDPETKKKDHVVILLRNGNQSSAYVDGKRVGEDVPCALGNTDSKVISHFYIGGDGKSAV